MPTVATSPTRPDDLTESPLYLLAVLYSARKSKDIALEQVTRKKLADLGVRVVFGDALHTLPHKGSRRHD